MIQNELQRQRQRQRQAQRQRERGSRDSDSAKICANFELELGLETELAASWRRGDVAAWAIAGQTRLDSHLGFHNNVVALSAVSPRIRIRIRIRFTVYSLFAQRKVKCIRDCKWKWEWEGEIIALSRFKRYHFLLSASGRASFVAIIMQFARLVRSRFRLWYWSLRIIISPVVFL